MKVNVYKTRPDAIIPTRAHSTDAGVDFYFCPVDNSSKRIEPGRCALLETGVKIEVPPGCMLQVMNKSGIATKTQLITGACVVDEGYDGEIFVNLQNVGTETQYISPGQKIAQGVFVKIEKPSFQILETDDVYGRQTSRGTGGFGSTGK
tara:strand:- start:777 stop:1223 length:447 start_codon:yes stop_codon:yes gene_type:complete